MSTETLATLTTADLLQWRKLTARIEAMALKPDGYNTMEIEVALFDRMKFWHETIDTYQLEDSSELTISAASGRIYLDV